MSWWDDRLATIDGLGEVLVQEGVLDVELACLPDEGEREAEDDGHH